MEIIEHFDYNKIICGNCFDILPQIPDDSVDLLFVDLPYGTTQASWDSILPLDKLWEQYNRIVKKNGAMLFTASQPFTTTLIASNINNYKYSWIWEKSKATNYLNAKKQPLRAYEEVVVFYRKQPTYNPQMTMGEAYNKGTALRLTDVYGSQKAVEVKSDGLRYPRNVLYFKTAESEGEVIHPTQKPVALIEYMIKTYTEEGAVILDNTAGSFSTAIAAQNTGRKRICIEQDREMCEKALKRFEKDL